MTLSHEAGTHLFLFLSAFAEAYPSLCEGEQKMYRDLARAAMICHEEERDCERLLLDHGVDAVLARVCLHEVGDYWLQKLRKCGFTVRLDKDAPDALRLLLSPSNKVTDAIAQTVRLHKRELATALLDEEVVRLGYQLSHEKDVDARNELIANGIHETGGKIRQLENTRCTAPRSAAAIDRA